jgi:outer membrane protein
MEMKLAFVLAFAVLYCNGQTPQVQQKIGHADWDYIFTQLPEYKKIESELKVYEAQLQNQFKIKSQELENKVKAYRSLPADTPDAIRKDKETELAYLEQNIQKFQQDAQISMQKKQTDLINPVFARVGKAIEEVAVERGYSYVINPQMIGGGDVLLFADAKNDISDLVLTKLGVEVTKPVPASTN